MTWEGSDAGGFYVCGQDGTGYTSRGNVVENNLCAFSLDRFERKHITSTKTPHATIGRFENILPRVSHPNQGHFGNENVVSSKRVPVAR